MSLLALPPELRLAIFDFIPSLNGRLAGWLASTIYISPEGFRTPAISRTCRLLRRETLQRHARNGVLSIVLPDDSANHPSDLPRHLVSWAKNLGTLRLTSLKSVELTKLLTSSSPVGCVLYLYLDTQATAGHPMWLVQAVVDHIRRARGSMRHESFELLGRAVESLLRKREDASVASRIDDDILTIAQAMDTMAQHQVLAYNYIDLDLHPDGFERSWEARSRLAEGAVIRFMRDKGVAMLPGESLSRARLIIPADTRGREASKPNTYLLN